MNKQELITEVAKEAKVTKAVATAALTATMKVITKAVAKKDEVKLIGFGTFGNKQRKARVGRNPQTGKEIKIPATRVPYFRPGSDFKNAVGKTSKKK